MLRRGRWGTCFGELKMRADLHGSTLRSGILGKLILPWVPDELIVKLRPHGGLAQSIARRQRQEIPTVFRDDFRAQLEAAETLPKIEFSERMGVRPYQLGLVAHGHMTMRIEGWSALGARYGITYAYPLLDRRIVELTLGVPPEMFMKKGWKRWLFRQSLEGILPDEVRWNPSKDDPALDISRQHRQEMAQTQVMPRLHNALLAWMDAGKSFHTLEAERVQAFLAAYQPPVFEENTPPPRNELIPAVMAEELVNPALAESIQTQIDGRNRL